MSRAVRITRVSVGTQSLGLSGFSALPNYFPVFVHMKLQGIFKIKHCFIRLSRVWALATFVFCPAGPSQSHRAEDN